MSDQQNFSGDVNRLSDEDWQIERSLASLVPRESQLNRDRLMFLAGQASALAANPPAHSWRSRWIWPATTLCAACAGLVIGAILPLRGPIAGNPVAVEQPRQSQESGTGAAERSNAPGTPQIADRAAEDDPSAVSSNETNNRMGNNLHANIAGGFTLLAFRDRMLASHWDDTALAQMDPSSGSDESATDVERPLGARALFERWIEYEGPAAH